MRDQLNVGVSSILRDQLNVGVSSILRDQLNVGVSSILRYQLKTSKLFNFNVVRINADLCIALMNPIKTHIKKNTIIIYYNIFIYIMHSLGFTDLYI